MNLDAFITLAFSLEGRDKLSKILQYGSRALAFYILSADPKSDVGQRLHALYQVMQQSRKAFRLGKSITYYKKLQILSCNKSLNETQRYLQFVQNFGMLGYFLTDNVAFASKAKVLRFDANEVARRGGIMWFTANIAGFYNALDSLNADMEKEKCVRDILISEEDSARIEMLQNQLETIQKDRFKNGLQCLKSHAILSCRPTQAVCDWPNVLQAQSYTTVSLVHLVVYRLQLCYILRGPL
ncbi:putative peroxisomal biogenesis factor 11 [Plasmopara halstedii]